MGFVLDEVVGFFRVVTEEKCSIIAKMLHLNSFFQSFIHSCILLFIVWRMDSGLIGDRCFIVSDSGESH